MASCHTHAACYREIYSQGVHAYCLYVNNTKVETKYSGLNRAYGLVIRPVSD